LQKHQDELDRLQLIRESIDPTGMVPNETPGLVASIKSPNNLTETPAGFFVLNLASEATSSVTSGPNVTATGNNEPELGENEPTSVNGTAGATTGWVTGGSVQICEESYSWPGVS
jgi:hypothetical protein